MRYRFDRFQADETAFRLTADGVPIAIEPKTLRLLLYLVQNRGRVIRKQEILDAVWEDAAVTENALTRSIGLLRKALNDDGRERRFIETVPTVGYRFIAEVETLPSEQTAPPAGKEAGARPVAGRNWVRPAAVVVLCLFVLATVSWLVAARLHSSPTIHSLAVLPLSNLSGDPGQDYFADGMTDELITQLAHIPNLRVVSRTSVMLDKNTKKSLPEIARELGVDAIVEGSTVQSGGRVRITAQLIDARSDRHLWAQSFEGPANDILGLQDTVAQQIAAQARLILVPTAPRPSVDPAAHDAYLRGRYFLNKQDIPHSLEYFQEAISMDPKYASAYAGYASALDSSSTFGFETPEDAMPKARAAALRAIELDPMNGEAYTALGSIQTIYQWDWTAAEQNLKRGISLNPNDSIAEFKYAVYLDAVDRPQDAVAHMRRAVQLDPLSFLMNRRLGATLYLAREYDAALAQLQRAAEMERLPGSIDNYVSLIYEQKGQQDLAVQHDLTALRADQPTWDVSALLVEYQRNGWQAYWRARAKALLGSPAGPCTAYEVGIDDVRVGERGQAFEFFNRALDRHCFYMALIQVDPLLDSVRQDPRYAALLRRIHQ